MNQNEASAPHFPASQPMSSGSSFLSTKKSVMKTGICASRGMQEASGLTLFSR